ncbi:MAG: hypothetical protein IJM63_10495 [Solobacterium sp.]|nr:hypothetical protein [Solobacterium sp.]MBQ9824917.1 hypothetical protein [Solobacterium sp.]
MHYWRHFWQLQSADAHPLKQLYQKTVPMSLSLKHRKQISRKKQSHRKKT